MNKIIFPKLYAPLLDDSITEIVEPSGRSTTKSTSNEIVAVNKMLESKFNNVWYCRAEVGDIREYIFASMISTIQMMGVEKLFKWSLSPYEITCIKTGAKCYFSGINGKTADDVTATKGFTPQFKTLCMAILDEADQVKHPNHITGFETTANKFLLPNGKFVFAYNPPITKSHWAHKFFNDKIKNGATRIYATWEDVRELLNPKTIEAILKFKRDDPEYYKYWYLGQSIAFKGLVYPQFNRQKHVTNIYKHIANGDMVTELILGLDEGTVFDSTCVTPLAVLRSGIAVVLDCFENDPIKNGQQSPSEQSRAIINYCNELILKFGFLKTVPRRWIFESAEAGQALMLQFMQDTFGTEDCVPVRNKSIMGDIKRLRTMLSEGVLLFHNDINVNTEILMSDIENYIFDEKTNTVKKGQRDDTIDSLEYATKLYYDVPITTY